MFVQGDDGNIYENPFIAKNNWYIYFPDFEPYLVLRGSKVVPREVLKFVKVKRDSYERIENQKFPPDWTKQFVGHRYCVDFIDVFPSILLKTYRGYFSQDIFPWSGSGFKIFQWKFTLEELKEVYEGKKHPFLRNVKNIPAKIASALKKEGLKNDDLYTSPAQKMRLKILIENR